MTEEQTRLPPSSGVERLEAEAGPHVRDAPVRFPTTGASAGHSPDLPDDTIELALTAEDVLVLSRAAEEEHAAASPGKSALVATDAFLHGQTVRTRRWPRVLASSVFGLGITMSVALGVVAHRISTVTIAPPSEAQGSAESLQSPVRFSNPFDASEVFEFAPGTSDEHARESVAGILLQRARDRQAADAVKSNPPLPGAAANRARVARNSEPRRT